VERPQSVYAVVRSVDRVHIDLLPFACMPCNAQGPM
jgi:hypothetical protein